MSAAPMKTDHLLLRHIGKLLAVWLTILLGMTNGWAVMQSPTSAQLVVTPSPAMAGQTVTLRMTVTGTNPAAPPTGLVTFKEGLAVLGSVNLNNGVAAFDTRFNTAGIHGVTATYAGDSNNGGTSMTTWFTVTAATTTTQLVPSVNPARPNQAVTLTATVTGVNPTGTVIFRNGNTILGTALLTAGTASITKTFNTVGNYLLTANYSGDTNNQASASAPVTLVVSLEPQVYYIHTDHLDTPRTITDTNGTAVWQWDNTDPFGANMPNENPGGAGPFSFNLRFAGQYFDRETSLNYNINRDYSPALGRYIESDPIELEGGINTFLYANANPLSNTDPLGLNPAVGCAAGAWAGPLGCGAGAAIGTAIMGGAALAAILSTPSDTPKQCKDNDDKCEKLLATDTATCNGISRMRGKAAGARCHASASQRYAACLRGQPIPPLDTWNN